MNNDLSIDCMSKRISEIIVLRVSIVSFVILTCLTGTMSNNSLQLNGIYRFIDAGNIVFEVNTGISVIANSPNHINRRFRLSFPQILEVPHRFLYDLLYINMTIFFRLYLSNSFQIRSTKSCATIKKNYIHFI